VEREFSAGGVLVRTIRGRTMSRRSVPAASARLGAAEGSHRRRRVAAETAMREVREETGVEGRLVEKLGDIRYVYTANWDERKGERIFKVVSFFLLRAGRGRIGEIDEAMQIEVAEARWLPLDEAPRLLSYSGERKMAARRWRGSRRDRRRRPHPGEMGAAVAARCASAARRALGLGRPERGDCRARDAAGLEDVGDVAEVCRRCEILLSICPPHAASRSHGRRAASRASTSTRTRSRPEPPGDREAAAALVDGGIVGPPPSRPGTTRLYLSGERRTVAALFAGTNLEHESSPASPVRRRR
jgi:8-oxo-dGTP pyrophosphatase MutT (NUDIX family)